MGNSKSQEKKCDKEKDDGLPEANIVKTRSILVYNIDGSSQFRNVSAKETAHEFLEYAFDYEKAHFYSVVLCLPMEEEKVMKTTDEFVEHLDAILSMKIVLKRDGVDKNPQTDDMNHAIHFKK